MSWEWELPRFLTALLAGFSLSLAGSLVQVTTRNELASPSTLGLDGLAVVFVMLSVLLEQLGLGWGSLAERSLALGLLAGLVGWWWSNRTRWQFSDDMRGVLLLGLAINLFIGAIFAVMQFLAMAFNYDFPDQLWFGRIQRLSTSSWLLSLLVWVPVLFFLWQNLSRWKVLLLGVGWCRGLGIPYDKLQRKSIVLAFLLTLWVVTQFGVFSFLGLLFPLVLRLSSRYRGEPAREATEGAILAALSFAALDHICYNITFHGAEFPVGLPVSLLGASALVVLLWEKARKH